MTDSTPGPRVEAVVTALEGRYHDPEPRLRDADCCHDHALHAPTDSRRLTDPVLYARGLIGRKSQPSLSVTSVHARRR